MPSSTEPANAAAGEPSPDRAAEIATTCPPTSGTLLERDGDMITLGLPGTDYRIELALDGLLEAEVGDKITGTIHAEALRVDRITAGGRYVEPVFGRPRRVQGTVVGGSLKERAVFVKAGGPTLACVLTDRRQQLADFVLHGMVSFDVKRGATFRPM